MRTGRRRPALRHRACPSCFFNRLRPRVRTDSRRGGENAGGSWSPWSFSWSDVIVFMLLGSLMLLSAVGVDGDEDVEAALKRYR
jgi:hypothetical protein